MTRRLFSIFSSGASLVLGLALLAGSTAHAQPNNNEFLKSNPQMFAAMTDVVAKPSTYTVRVRCLDKDAALGTIVGPDGWIITKSSELKGPAKVTLKDGRIFDAKLVGVHTDTDLAMLKIEANGLPTPEWRDSKEATIGGWLATPGIGKEPIGVGVVSVATRSMPKERTFPTARSGYLGIRMQDSESGGVRIEAVDAKTPAEKAGIKAGDVIVGLDDEEIKNREQLAERLAGRKPGDEVTVVLMRDGNRIELKATLGRRPPQALDRGEMQNNMGSVLSDRRTNFPLVLQHDTVLKPSDCGGPLVDLDGKVIGINIARAGRTETYALPSEAVRGVLFDLMSGNLAPVASTKPKTAAERLAEAEAIKARALAAKTAAEKEIKDADDAIAKAKKEIEDQKKKADAEKKKDEPAKK